MSNTIDVKAGLIRTEEYGYDALNRLTSVDYDDGQTQTYTFDAMGNRTQKADSVTGTENYTYNNANMLLTRGMNSYTNDDNGNTLTGGGRTNSWDGQNRLAQCVYGGTTTTFTYGYDGLRHSSASSGTTTNFVLEGENVLRETQGGSPVATYLHGPRGPESRRDGSNVYRWFVYDGLGSVLAEVDASGTVTATRKYDVYGSVRGTTGTATSKHKFVGSLGHPSEDETGLVYMRARFYDPVTGRFEREDQKADGVNWYVYCSNSPTNNVDPSGEASLYNQLRLMAVATAAELGMMFTLLALVALSATMPAQAFSCANNAVWCFVVALGGSDCFIGTGAGIASGRLFGQWAKLMEATIKAAEPLERSSAICPIAKKAVLAAVSYSLVCIAACMLDFNFNGDK